MPNMQDDDLAGFFTHGIEDQKRLSHHRHHAYALLISTLTYKRKFADQRGKPLNSSDDRCGSGPVALMYRTFMRGSEQTPLLPHPHSPACPLASLEGRAGPQPVLRH